MKVFVMSDSHGMRSFMRYAVTAVKPNVIIHLGDHYDDGSIIAEENDNIRFLQVPGNCDRYRCYPPQPEILCCDIGGVRCYMTHGHLHGVKMSTGRLIRDAAEAKASVVLYGHTHQADCRQEQGIWILNPGTCGSWGGTVGVITVENGQVIQCTILDQKDLEEQT